MSGILLDTGVVSCLMSAPDTRLYVYKEHYGQLVMENRCFTSPVTVAEILNNRWVSTLGTRRQEELEGFLSDTECLDITEAIAHEHKDLEWRKNKIPGSHDQWQVALASFHGLMLATLDRNLADASYHLIEVLQIPF